MSATVQYLVKVNGFVVIDLYCWFHQTQGPFIASGLKVKVKVDSFLLGQISVCTMTDLASYKVQQFLLWNSGSVRRDTGA